MMFAQANSEHCRHKIFNAALGHRWRGAGRKPLPDDPLDPCDESAPGVLSAYRDNAAVIEGAVAGAPARRSGQRQLPPPVRRVHTLMKVETHNHPTAISPVSGRGHRLWRRVA